MLSNLVWKLQFWVVCFGPHPVDGTEYRRLLHNAPLQGVFAREVHQHDSQQDGEDPLPGQYQHSHTGQDKDNTEQVLQHGAESIQRPVWVGSATAPMAHEVIRWDAHDE